MIDISRDIQSLTVFKRQTNKLIARLRKTGHPVVLTVNGSASVVVQDAAAYQALLELVERAEAIVGVRNGLESVKRSQGKPAGEVLERLRKKHKIPRAR